MLQRRVAIAFGFKMAPTSHQKYALSELETKVVSFAEATGQVTSWKKMPESVQSSLAEIMAEHNKKVENVVSN